jgi:hypothetical protein
VVEAPQKDCTRESTCRKDNVRGCGTFRKNFAGVTEAPRFSIMLRSRMIPKKSTHSGRRRSLYYGLAFCFLVFLGLLSLFLTNRPLWFATVGSGFSSDKDIDGMENWIVPTLTYTVLDDPATIDFLGEWMGWYSFTQGFRGQKGTVVYLRNIPELEQHSKLKNCTPVLDVLAWVTHECKLRDQGAMLAYGGLIYLHRDLDFVDTETGEFRDDDFDLWVSPESVVLLGRLEPELFARFGWTLRLFVMNQFVVFAQLTASCGHKPVFEADKITANEPGIDLYPLSTVQIEGETFLKDLWQMNLFPESMIYPVRYATISTPAASSPLQLQLPQKSLQILQCFYGDWTVPSSSKGDTWDKRC